MRIAHYGNSTAMMCRFLMSFFFFFIIRLFVAVNWERHLMQHLCQLPDDRSIIIIGFEVKSVTDVILDN